MKKKTNWVEILKSEKIFNFNADVYKLAKPKSIKIKGRL
jgi:hypothetical protein